MKLIKKTALVAMPLALLMNAGTISAATWDVTVTNLTHANIFTPLVLTANAHDAPVFSVGTSASLPLEHLAECGHTAPLISALGGADADTIENPNSGLLNPGATSTSAQIVTTDTHLSVVAMILPTNDAFVGLSQHIPDFNTAANANNTYTYYVMAYDAGTEGNDEVLAASGSTCTYTDTGLMPGAPGGDAGTGGTGVVTPGTADSNMTVHIHRGVLGDQDPTGGISDLDSSVHRWQNPVAKVVVVVSQ